MREELEGLALLLLLGVLLGVAAQVDALAKVVECGQVLAPVRVDGLQHHHAHEGRELLAADDVELALVHGTAGVIALAHLGACTRETEESCGSMAVNQLRDYLKHRNSIDIVNFRCVSMR